MWPPPCPGLIGMGCMGGVAGGGGIGIGPPQHPGFIPPSAIGAIGAPASIGAIPPFLPALGIGFPASLLIAPVPVGAIAVPLAGIPGIPGIPVDDPAAFGGVVTCKLGSTSDAGAPLVWVGVVAGGGMFMPSPPR